MSTHTVNTTTTATATMSTAMTPAARSRPTPRRPKPARISVARQVQQQRRGYATAVLRTLARTHRDDPPPRFTPRCAAAWRPWGCA
jgi:hypothetical protein